MKINHIKFGIPFFVLLIISLKKARFEKGSFVFDFKLFEINFCYLVDTQNFFKSSVVLFELAQYNDYPIRECHLLKYLHNYAFALTFEKQTKDKR